MICFLFISYLTELPELLEWNEVSYLAEIFQDQDRQFQIWKRWERGNIEIWAWRQRERERKRKNENERERVRQREWEWERESKTEREGEREGEMKMEREGERQKNKSNEDSSREEKCKVKSEHHMYMTSIWKGHLLTPFFQSHINEGSLSGNYPGYLRWSEGYRCKDNDREIEWERLIEI